MLSWMHLRCWRSFMGSPAAERVVAVLDRAAISAVILAES